MPKQPRFNPPFEGPFLGLNSTSDPGRLGQQYARICRNVLLSDGRISSRPPWRMVDTKPDFGLEWAPDGTVSRHKAIVKGMFHWRRSTGTSFVIAKLASGTRGDGRASTCGYYRVQTRVSPYGPVPERMVELTGGMGLDSPHAPCFVESGRYLYILDGGDSAIRTDGFSAQWSGIHAPAPEHVTLAYGVSVAAGAGIGAEVAYAITWYDSLRGIESNPLYSASYTHGTAEAFSYGQAALESTVPSGYGISGVRVYRKNLDLNQVGYRLIAEHVLTDFADAAILDQVDGSSSDAEDTALAGVSDRINGPWAPSRNFVPKNPLVGTIYKDRMFYSSNRLPAFGQLRYCAIGRPEYAHDDDVLEAGGEINGMIAMGDQLYVGKRRGIRVLSGEIITATNFTVATGDAPLDSPHRWYEAQGVDVGPVGTSGNSMFLAGEPTRIYMISDVGLVEFDGVTTRVVSDAIRPTWRAFVNPPSFLPGVHIADQQLIAFSFGHDAENGILYMANDRLTKSKQPDGMDVIDCLAYHYKVNRGDGVGAWSQIDDGDLKLESTGYPDGHPFVVTCVANSLGHFTELREPAPINIGTNLSAVLQSSPDDPTALMPQWKYITGDIPVLRGYRGHVYYVRVFVNRAVRVNGSTSGHLLAVQVTLDRNPAIAVPERRPLRSVEEAVPVGRGGGPYREVGPIHTAIEIDPSQVDDKLMPIRAHAKTVAIEFRKAGSWIDGWSSHVGVLGWSMDVEPIGQR